jgi:hypothetical protein
MWFKDDAGSMYHFPQGVNLLYIRGQRNGKPVWSLVKTAPPAILGIYAQPNSPVEYKLILCEFLEKLTEITGTEVDEALSRMPELEAELRFQAEQEMQARMR